MKGSGHTVKNKKVFVVLILVFMITGSFFSLFSVVPAQGGEYVSTETTKAFQGIDVTSSGSYMLALEIQSTRVQTTVQLGCLSRRFQVLMK